MVMVANRSRRKIQRRPSEPARRPVVRDPHLPRPGRRMAAAGPPCGI